MSEVDEAGQLQLIEPPFIRIVRHTCGGMCLKAECIHGTRYRFRVRHGEVWLHAGGVAEREVRLPSRFGVPQTWTELVNLAYRVLVEAPCHHAG
jgi:hypothetical protein